MAEKYTIFIAFAYGMNSILPKNLKIKQILRINCKKNKKNAKFN